jgi:hypothetical protein
MSADGELQWDSTPSTRQIRLAQEDLWVYQALLRTIAATNEAQTYFHKMPVKRIDALDIAQAAAESFVKAEGRIVTIPSAAGPGRIQTGAQAAAVGKRGSSGGQMLSSGGSGGAVRSTDILTDYRYVNQLGMPLRGDEKPPFEEYNMMPIHMRLLMNQRKIVNLIVNLANSSMPIEVRRVSIRPGEQGSAIDFGRFLPSKGPGGGMGAGMPSPGPAGTTGFMPGGEGSRHGAGGGSRQGVGMGGYADADDLAADERDPLDLPVEIDGIIYIFNVPKKEKLGTGTVATTAAAAATAPAAVKTPAATGATPAAAPAAPSAKPAAPTAAPAAPGAAPTAPATAPATPGAPRVPSAAGQPGTTPTAPAGVSGSPR